MGAVHIGLVVNGRRNG